MTISRPKVSKRIEHQAKGINLAPGILFHARTIDLEPVGVTGLHFDRASIFGDQRRFVVVTVVGIKPAIETTTKRACQSVGVSFKPKATEEQLLAIRAPIAIGVFKKVNVGNAEGDDAILRCV